MTLWKENKEICQLTVWQSCEKDNESAFVCFPEAVCRLLPQSHCVDVNYQHCHLIYGGVMVWSVNAVVPSLPPFPPQPPPPPHALVSAILEGVTLCLMIIHSHLSFSVPSEELCAGCTCIYVFTALWKVRKSSWSTTLLLSCMPNTYLIHLLLWCYISVQVISNKV